MLALMSDLKDVYSMWTGSVFENKCIVKFPRTGLNGEEDAKILDDTGSDDDIYRTQYNEEMRYVYFIV